MKISYIYLTLTNTVLSTNMENMPLFMDNVTNGKKSILSQDDSYS
jgi:hypothetical protein